MRYVCVHDMMYVCIVYVQQPPTIYIQLYHSVSQDIFAYSFAQLQHQSSRNQNSADTHHQPSPIPSYPSQLICTVTSHLKLPPLPYPSPNRFCTTLANRART